MNERSEGDKGLFKACERTKEEKKKRCILLAPMIIRNGAYVACHTVSYPMQICV